MTYAEAMEAYQVYLEGVRAYPDDEDLLREFALAKKTLEVMYLEYTMARSSSG